MVVADMQPGMAGKGRAMATTRDRNFAHVARARDYLRRAATELRALDKSSDGDAPMAYRLSVRVEQLISDVAELPAAKD